MTDNTTLNLLEAAAAHYQLLRKRRDHLIVKARREGIPIRTIAAAAGVSHQTVVNIINRTK